MKALALISVLIFISSCTLSVKTDTKKDEQNICVEKELYIGPKVGKN